MISCPAVTALPLRWNDDSLKINEYVPFLIIVVRPPPPLFTIKATGNPPLTFRMNFVGNLGLSNKGAKTISAEGDKFPVDSIYSTLCLSLELIVFTTISTNACWSSLSVIPLKAVESASGERNRCKGFPILFFPGSEESEDEDGENCRRRYETQAERHRRHPYRPRMPRRRKLLPYYPAVKHPSHIDGNQHPACRQKYV